MYIYPLLAPAKMEKSLHEIVFTKNILIEIDVLKNIHVRLETFYPSLKSFFFCRLTFTLGHNIKGLYSRVLTRSIRT